MFSVFRDTRHIKYAPLTTQDSELISPYWDDEGENMRFELQELVTKERNHRRRTWLIIGVLALIVLVAVVAILLVTSSGTNNSEISASLLGNQPPSITLEDFLDGRLAPHSFNATWVSGDELLYRDTLENLVLHNVATREIKVLLAADQIPNGAFDQELSGDRKYLLIAHNFQKLYSRYSFLAQYMIVEIATGKQTPLSTASNQQTLQLAAWGPEKNSLIYIYKNNIYFRSSVVGNEVQLTGNGEQGKIYNGVPDWVYEEEVLGTNKAFWFSPKGKRMAYITLNDINVGIMSIPIYGQPDNINFQYTKYIPLRYPKAGTPNPIVGLETVDLDSASRTIPISQSILPPPTLGKEPVLSAVAWANEHTVCAIWLNRIQNKAEIVSCDSETATCETVISIEQKNGWLELFTPPLFSKDGTKMLLIMSHDQGSNYGSYRHVTMIEHRENGKVTPLTHGRFVVTEIISWDEQKQLVYFLGTSINDPAEQHLYTVSTNTKQIECISCKTKSTNDKRGCTYNAAAFSTDSSHYTLNCAGPGVPEIAIYSSAHKKLETWEQNEEIHELVEDKLIPKFEKMQVELGGGMTAQVMLQLPPNIDKTGNVKYPMIVNVYGGPDSYAVVDKFNLNWFSYLASNKSIIVAAIDGRGSGLKGDKMLFSGYGHLGTVEIFDQINITRHLHKKLPFADPKRSAIWGWSYGGYASGMALATDTDNVFKCGISIAPVTDWTLYDSIYTERFMGIPEGKQMTAYREASLLNKAEKLRNKQYLLIHGTQDDNVHYQQSMFLARALELKDIQFRQQSYPDEDHGLTSVRRHLYHTFENFLDECFEPES